MTTPKYDHIGVVFDLKHSAYEERHSNNNTAIVSTIANDPAKLIIGKTGRVVNWKQGGLETDVTLIKVKKVQSNRWTHRLYFRKF